jgi:hypothetical protein
MNSEPTAPSRKETVYDGPETDLFKPRHLKSDAAVQNSGKETVHQGDVPEFIIRRFSAARVSELQKPQTETVYQGHHIPEMFLKLGRIAQDLVMPDRETIYQGPDIVRQVVDISHLETKPESGVQKETVFDESTFIAKTIDTTAARSLVTRLVQRASVRFFAVAILSLVELYLCRNNLPVAISSGFMFVTFAVVGFYTFKLNLKALLFAIGIYALTTLFMLSNAVLEDNLFVLMLPLLSRGFMIYNLLRTYGLLVDLHLLEAGVY